MLSILASATTVQPPAVSASFIAACAWPRGQAAPARACPCNDQHSRWSPALPIPAWAADPIDCRGASTICPSSKLTCKSLWLVVVVLEGVSRRSHFLALAEKFGKARFFFRSTVSRSCSRSHSIFGCSDIGARHLQRSTRKFGSAQRPTTALRRGAGRYLVATIGTALRRAGVSLSLMSLPGKGIRKPTGTAYTAGTAQPSLRRRGPNRTDCGRAVWPVVIRTCRKSHRRKRGPKPVTSISCP